MSIVPFSAPSGAWPPTQWQTDGARIVPTAPQLVISQTTTLISLVVANAANADVTITVTDNSTNGVAGAPCPLVPAVVVAANTLMVIVLGGLSANGGCSWSASAANSLSAWLHGAY